MISANKLIFLYIYNTIHFNIKEQVDLRQNLQLMTDTVEGSHTSSLNHRLAYDVSSDHTQFQKTKRPRAMLPNLSN